jgi:hypothetical protein
MIFPYIKVPTKEPVFLLGNVYYRFRPLIRVRVAGPIRMKHVWATLDSGSDDTLFPLELAKYLGVHLTSAPTGAANAVGGARFEYPYAKVQLHIESRDGEVCTWSTMVGFTEARENLGLLGQESMFSYFNIGFSKIKDEMNITPNSAFPGLWIGVH